MKIFLSILLAISLSSIINAQDFAPVGAKWWYTQVDLFNPFFKSYSTIESIQDTIISNQSCRKLLTTYNNAFAEATFETYYMYSEDRIIYQYSEDAARFLQLYDFNKEVGDTFVMEGYYVGSAQIEPLKAIIDSVDSVEINSVMLKRIYTHSNDGLNWDFLGWSTELIGHDHFLFPFGDNFTTAPLRCYQDSLLGLYETGTAPSCEFVVAVNEADNEKSFIISPNPASNFISIRFSGKYLQSPYIVSISNGIGKIFLTRTFSSKENESDISALEPGIYLLQIDYEGGMAVKKFIRQ
jgi:hypothetical protein